jgi:hypothetical protein
MEERLITSFLVKAGSNSIRSTAQPEESKTKGKEEM